MSLKTLKIEKDLCRCCHAEGKFQNFAEPLLHLGRMEDYSQIMRSCLNVEISPVQGALAASTYTICNECIQRLRDANNFRQQVVLCEERFKYMYCEFLNNQEVVKLELSSDDELKVEFIQDDDDRLDIRFDDSDDEPVILVKDEESKKTKTKPKPKPKTKSKKPAGVQNSSNNEKKGAKGNSTKFVLKDTDFRKEGNNYCCTQCDKVYDKQFSLRHHVKTKHYKIPIHTCSYCKKEFMTPAPLTVHKLEEHNIDERFKCKACNAAFNTKVQLRKHINNYHMLGEKHKCQFCDYETFSFEGLYKHKFKHRTVKEFQCRFCKKAFLRKATLDLHERIHTGDRRKVCKICGQAFVQKASLNYHMTKYHPEVNF